MSVTGVFLLNTKAVKETIRSTEGNLIALECSLSLHCRCWYVHRYVGRIFLCSKAGIFGCYHISWLTHEAFHFKNVLSEQLAKPMGEKIIKCTILTIYNDHNCGWRLFMLLLWNEIYGWHSRKYRFPYQKNAIGTISLSIFVCVNLVKKLTLKKCIKTRSMFHSLSYS